MTLNDSAPCHTNPLCAKGCGESGDRRAALRRNAVMVALAEFGIMQLTTPLTPRKIQTVIREAPSVDGAISVAAGVRTRKTMGNFPKGDGLMKRRDFLKISTTGAAAAAVASRAIPQSAPEIKWRMTSSFPKSLDTIYGGAAEFAKYVAEMTDSKSSSTVQWCG